MSQNLGMGSEVAKSLYRINSLFREERREKNRESMWPETRQSSEEFAVGREIL